MVAATSTASRVAPPSMPYVSQQLSKTDFVVDIMSWHNIPKLIVCHPTRYRVRVRMDGLVYL